MEAYIVSPQRQRIPDNIDEAKNRLCRKLANYCREKPTNIFDLVKLVKVRDKIKTLVEKDGVIWCSNVCPLEL